MEERVTISDESVGEGEGEGGGGCFGGDCGNGGSEWRRAWVGR